MNAPWASLAQAAGAGAARLRAAWENPHAAQAALLARILRGAAGSLFGREHGFHAIDGPAEFRARVPMRGYDDLAPWIARQERGEPGVLTSHSPLCFEETSGSGGARKLIPYTASSLEDFRAAALPWLDAVAAHAPPDRRGAIYLALSPALRAPRLTAGGAPIGLPDAAYLGPELGAALTRLLAVAPQSAATQDVALWRRSTLTQLVACERLALVSVWSPTFFTALLDALPQEADAIAPSLSPERRAALGAALAGGGLRARALWPWLSAVSCWTDGPSASFAQALRERLDGVRLHPKGLMATEAAVTTPLRLSEGVEPRAPALLSAYLEFLDENGDSHAPHALREGEAYRVLVTTSGGLYRYKLGDKVRCEGFMRRQGILTPDLAFLARDHVSDLVGEKLSEAFVQSALGAAPFPSALRPRRAPAGYEWLVETRSSGEPLASWRDGVEAALRANPHYAYARDMGQLAALTVTPVASLDTAFAHSGARLASVKPRALLATSLEMQSE